MLPGSGSIATKALAEYGATTYQKSLSTTLTLSGATTKRVVPANKTGTVSLSGALTAMAVKVQDAASELTLSGALVKIPAKVLSGTLTLAGATLAKLVIPTNKTGTVSLSGALTSIKVATATFTGTLTLAATLVKKFLQISGANDIQLDGLLSKALSPPTKTGTVTLTGASIVRMPIKAIARTLSLIASAFSTLFIPAEKPVIEDRIDFAYTITDELDFTYQTTDTIDF